jgi:transposase InsO family protein
MVTTRAMNDKERRTARSRAFICFLTIPGACIFYTLGWFVKDLPDYFYVAIAIIPTLAAIFICKQGLQYIRDIRTNEVRTEIGIVTSKVFYRSPMQNGKHHSTRRYIVLNNKQYNLSTKHFRNIIEGSQAQLAYGLHSGDVLSVKSGISQ